MTSPRIVDSDIKFEKIQAGGNHSLAISKDRQVYGWGLNKTQQLAFWKDFIWSDENKDLIFSPTSLGEYFSAWKAVHIAAGQDFSIFVL